MHTYSIDDVRESVGERALARGALYQKQRRVTLIDALDGQITGRVQGTRRAPYKVIVHLKANGHGVHISGACSCPMAYNCKHVAALLLGAAAKTNGQSSRPSREGPHLAADLAKWLGQLDDAGKTSTEDYPPDIRHRLLYVLACAESADGLPDLHVQPYSVRLRKDGSLGSARKRYDAGNLQAVQPAKFLRPSDHRILRALLGMRTHFINHGGILLHGHEAGETLRTILTTGRCRWQQVDGPTLAEGEPRPAEPEWRLKPDGRQRFGFACAGSDRILALSPPWYLDLSAGQCGPLETGLPGAVAALLLTAPAVPPGQASGLRDELARRFPGRQELLVRQLPQAEALTAPPLPRLRLFAKDVRRAGYWYFDPDAAPTEAVAFARLSFDYGGVEVGLDERHPRPARVRDGMLLEVVRDLEAERDASERLTSLGFVQADDCEEVDVPRAHAHDLLARLSECRDRLLTFTFRHVPRLRAEGWQVEIEDDWPLTLAEPSEQWTMDVGSGSDGGIDWFQFDLGVVVDGERLDLLPILVRLLKEHQDVPPLDPADDGADVAISDGGDDHSHVFVPLPDGRYLPLPRRRLRPLLAGLFELYGTGDLEAEGPVRLPSLRAAELTALEHATDGTGVVWQGGEPYRELGQRLNAFVGITEAAVPDGFRGDLRSYQREGLSWLQFLREFNFNGILADDMGLGKTVQTLAHLLIEKAAGRMDRPSLVVAPTSLIANWRLEAQRFAPDLDVLTLHGLGRKEHFAQIASADLVLTTYALLPRDRDVLSAHAYHVLVLDEAQAIKNPRAIVTREVTRLQARHRLCLTGTPLENHLGELWSIMHFLNPGLLGERDHFTKIFRGPIEKRQEAGRRDTLRRRIKPFLLRRGKAEVERDLPAKTQIVEHVELEAAQRDVYESIRVAMHKRVRDEMARKGLGRSHIVILDALLKLRQACCDPRLLKLKRIGSKAGSAKLDRLMEMVPEMLDEGRRVLLFSQFTSMLALIETELGKRGIAFARLTGNTLDRETPIRRFQSGEVPLFLISLKAGGFGLNLTAADTVIHYDPWWNPAVEAQASDRAHRIGQTRPVFVYKLITLGTVEQKIVELQERKRDLADALLDSGAATSASKLTREDLDNLFAPLA